MVWDTLEVFMMCMRFKERKWLKGPTKCFQWITGSGPTALTHHKHGVSSHSKQQGPLHCQEVRRYIISIFQKYVPSEKQSCITWVLSLDQVCVHVEHAFAVLKGQFQSLHELRLQMNSLKDIQIATHWIQCCLILHNMIIRFEDKLNVESTTQWAIQEGQESSDDDGDNGGAEIDAAQWTPGQQFWLELAECLFRERRIHERI